MFPWNYGGAPFSPQTMMSYNNKIPSAAIHAVDTVTSQFFQRYLWQDLIGVLKWDIPETWSYDYFTYCIYVYGFAAIINTDRFGVIPQAATPGGYNVFYEPSFVSITNPLLKGILQPVIGKQCTVIRLNADWCGMSDLIQYYADLMALTIESAGINLLNSHLAYVFFAENKAAAETFKDMYDKIAKGDPAVVIDAKTKRNPNVDNPWMPFTNNLNQNFIADKIFETLKQIENKFLTEIGIPNSNDQKKERMLVDEVNSNNVQTAIAPMSRLDRMKKGCEETNKMFGTNISVDWRVKPEMLGGGENERDTSGRMDDTRR